MSDFVLLGREKNYKLLWEEETKISILQYKTEAKLADFSQKSRKEHIVYHKGGRWCMVKKVFGVCGAEIVVPVKVYKALERIPKCLTDDVTNYQYVCDEGELVYVFCFSQLNGFDEVTAYTDHYGVFKRPFYSMKLEETDRGIENMPFDVLLKGIYKDENGNEKEAYMIPLPKQTHAWISEDMIANGYASIREFPGLEVPKLPPYNPEKESGCNVGDKEESGDQPPCKKQKLNEGSFQPEVPTDGLVDCAASQGEEQVQAQGEEELQLWQQQRQEALRLLQKLSCEQQQQQQEIQEMKVQIQQQRQHHQQQQIKLQEMQKMLIWMQQQQQFTVQYMNN